MALNLKISKAGDNVQTVEEKDLLFFSEHSTLKIFIDRVDSIGNGVTLNIAHGLSYIPAFMVFGQNSTGAWFPINGGAVLAGPTAYATADSTNINITNNDGATRGFRTFVFIDRIV